MLKNLLLKVLGNKNLLFKTLGDEKDPDKRMWQIILIVTVPVLFWMVINGLSGNNKDCKAEINDLKLKVDRQEVEIRGLRKNTDSLTIVIFDDRLDFIVEKDKYSKQLDSISFKIQKIK